MLRTHLLAWIERYLTGAASRENMGKWLLSHLQEILDSGDGRAIALANKIDADLVEFSEKLIDERILQERFTRYVANYSTSSEYRTQGNSETDVMFSPVGVPGAEMMVHFRHVVVA